jgi:serine O-acetyltransferase
MVSFVSFSPFEITEGGGWMNANKVNGPDQRRWSWLVSVVREDLAANKGHWERAGYHAVVVFRYGVWASQQRGLLGFLANLVYRILFGFVRNIYSTELPRGTKVGRRLWIPHPAGIVVSSQSEIGDDCLILQNVTIGLGGHRGRRKRPGPHAPRIGNGVEIGAGAVVMGGITVGDGARIGPNAVVLTDVPAGGTAFATPTKIMKPLGAKPRTKLEEPAETKTE